MNVDKERKPKCTCASGEKGRERMRQRMRERMRERKREFAVRATDLMSYFVIVHHRDLKTRLISEVIVVPDVTLVSVTGACFVVCMIVNV